MINAVPEHMIDEDENVIDEFDTSYIDGLALIFILL